MNRSPHTFANMWLCWQHYVSHYCCHLVSSFDFFIYKKNGGALKSLNFM